MPTLTAKRGRRSAITLVELTMALALGAIVVAVALRAYYWSAENERVRQAISLIGIARDSISSRYGMQPDYVNLSNSMVVSAFPKSLVVDGSSNIRDPFGGHLIVGPDRVSNIGDSNYIAMTNLTPNACNKLARADMGRDAAFIAVGTSGPVNKSMALPLSAQDQATVDAQCKASERVSVSWQFAAAGNSVVVSTPPNQCLWGPCQDVAPLDYLDQWLVNHPGDPLYVGYVASASQSLWADIMHFSWASLNPNDPADSSRAMILNAMLYVTGKDFNSTQAGAFTAQDFSLAVAYLQYKAVPSRAGDAGIQSSMMGVINGVAATMRQEAASRGMPGF